MLVNTKQRGVYTSPREIHDLAKAWLFLSIAFAIATSSFSLTTSFLNSLVIAALTVGIGFILHELAHKVVAQRYGCWAEFRSFDTMLWIALIFSFAGFLFAAPGAVMIHGPIGTNRSGKIAAAGPITNIALALVFLGLSFAGNNPLLQAIASSGYRVNAFLALFNMIPVLMLDGRKVWLWNKAAYAGIVFVSIMLFLIRV